MIAAIRYRRHQCLAVLGAAIACACGGNPPPQGPAVPDDPQLARPAAAAPGRVAAAEPAAPAGLIAGRAIALAGGPLSRVRIQARRLEDGGAYYTLTDDSGRYVLPDLPTGSYLVTATKTGFVPASYGQPAPAQPGVPVRLAARQPREDIDFALSRGWAISGRVLDADATPLGAAIVEALRPLITEGGDQRVTVAAAAQSDDRGEFRLFGLAPGVYYVRAFDSALGLNPDDPENPAVSPTFYPGVTQMAEASMVRIEAGQDTGGLTIPLRFVPAARIAGALVTPTRQPLFGASAIMIPAQPGRSAAAPPLSARIGPDGTYEFTAVPPGRYLILARGVPRQEGAQRGEPLYASFTTSVEGRDITGLDLVLRPGATAGGRVEFERGPLPPPADLTQIWVRAALADGTRFGTEPRRVAPDGSFRLAGVPAGAHLFRAEGLPRPWSLKAVLLRGRDITDVPLDLDHGQHVAAVVIVFSAGATELTGLVRDRRDEPVWDCAVILFPADSSLWQPLSRHLRLVRPDADGRYRVRGLPAGSYFAVAVDAADETDLLDPDWLGELARGAVRVTLAEGEVVTQDLRLDPQRQAIAGLTSLKARITD